MRRPRGTSQEELRSAFCSAVSSSGLSTGCFSETRGMSVGQVLWSSIYTTQDS